MSDELLPSTDGIDIPGLSFRRFRDASDYERIAGLILAANRHDTIEYVPTAPSIQNEFEHKNGFVPARDVLLAERDGGLVGFGMTNRDVRDGIAVYWTGGTVLPDARRRGLGRAVLRANEAQARKNAEGHPEDGERAFASWVDHKEGGARELLESEGYAPARYGMSMIRPTLDGIPDIPMPDGLEIRPVTEEHHRAIFEADDEAFRDHWGHRDATEADFEATYAEPELDTSLWRIAWDGDQVAGTVLTYIWKKENAELGVKRGWLERIAVRRPWRRRGLAKALIASALHGLRDAGMDAAMLGVETQNLSGAVELYRTMGFVDHELATHYRKPWS